MHTNSLGERAYEPADPEFRQPLRRRDIAGTGDDDGNKRRPEQRPIPERARDQQRLQ